MTKLHHLLTDLLNNSLSWNNASGQVWIWRIGNSWSLGKESQSQSLLLQASGTGTFKIRKYIIFILIQLTWYFCRCAWVFDSRANIKDFWQVFLQSNFSAQFLSLWYGKYWNALDCDAFYSIFIYQKSLISVLWVFQIRDVSVFLACSGVQNMNSKTKQCLYLNPIPPR